MDNLPAIIQNAPEYAPWAILGALVGTAIGFWANNRDGVDLPDPWALGGIGMLAAVTIRWLALG
ncbi:hypothetical protein LL946_18545 [Knoellia locipacati]|uniref:hypothetical protein n=1 Tax=Knoellia locipacati TaxID=882824 RepID=UPI003850EE29